MSQQFEVFIGGYGKGVAVSKLDPLTGALSEVGAVGEVVSASFVAPHPILPIIYAVSEVDAGVVVALRREPDGSLKEMSRQSSGGNGPCHLSVHPTGNAVFVANYGDGRASMILLSEDGTFTDHLFIDQHEGNGPNEKRQEHARAHSFYPHPDGRHAVSADLGCDALFIYRIDVPNRRLTDRKTVPMTPGSGPRHLAITRDGRFIYVVCEMANSIEVLRWNADGELSGVQSISTLPGGADQSGTSAEVRLHPSGKYLYATNRGHDSVAAFRVDADTGRLTFIAAVPSGGNSPRGMEIDPSGRYLLVANQRSDRVATFRIDPQTGALSESGSSLSIEKPACVRFAASMP
jgi:6-phosphogluconolactonase